MSPRQRPAENLTEILVAAISPTLIIFMVGSLVFFLTHLFYDGQFPGRLRMSSGLFVFAAVLVSRISIDDGREYASLFALPLSIVTLLSILKYTDAGLPLVIPLVAFIWWSTDKLTWDCTVVDYRKDASGEGLLQTVGLDQDEGDESVLDQEATTDVEASEAASFWARWVEHRKRHHAPGVWVIYFGVAALPIFGLGQAWIPEYARGEGFLLLCVYVACTLALLMTTSFLQLRRYLIQRRLPLTGQTVSIWLVTGALMIVSLMGVCLLLPRPNTGYSVIDSVASAVDEQASQFGVGNEGVDDPKVQGNAQRGEQARSESSSGRQTSREAEQGNLQGQSGEPNGESSGRQQSGSRSGSQSGARQQSDGRQQAPNAGEEGRASGDKTRGNERSDDQGQRAPADAPADQASSDDPSAAARGQPSTATSPPPPAADFWQRLSPGSAVKWIYFAIVGLLAVYLLVRHAATLLSSLTAFLRDFVEFWRRLFGFSSQAEAVEDAEASPQEAAVFRSFASFQDPFQSGLASQWSPRELVNYTFEALQAWAAERDCGRAAEQTPLEFATQLGRKDQHVAALVRNLAVLYNQAAYAPGTLGPETTDLVRPIWLVLGRGRNA